MEDSLDLLDEDDVLQNFDYFFSNHASYFASPEKNLMMSVLLYGIMDFLSSRKDAEVWFNDDSDHLFSLSNICFEMGFDYKKFKEKVIILKNTPGKKRKMRHRPKSEIKNA